MPDRSSPDAAIERNSALADVLSVAASLARRCLCVDDSTWTDAQDEMSVQMALKLRRALDRLAALPVAPVVKVSEALEDELAEALARIDELEAALPVADLDDSERDPIAALNRLGHLVAGFSLDMSEGQHAKLSKAVQRVLMSADWPKVDFNPEPDVVLYRGQRYRVVPCPPGAVGAEPSLFRLVPLSDPAPPEAQ